MNTLIASIQEMLQKPNEDILFNPVVNEISRARGLGSGNQCYRVMYMVAQYFNVHRVLEIGTHKGVSSIVFCQAVLDDDRVPELPEIHTIDNWSQKDHEQLARSNIEKAGFAKFVTMHSGDSITKVPEVFKQIGKVDLAFIDGKHTIDYVTRDYHNCKSFSDRILFHDTGKGKASYLKRAREEGFIIHNFETRYIEGDGHLIGIALACREVSHVR